MIPIYQDTFYTFTADTLSYYITYDGDVIYQGRAYRFPDDATGRIKINKIAEDYIKMDFPRLSVITATTTYNHSEAVGEFLLYDEEDTLLATYEFAYDWDYDKELFSANKALSCPPSDKYAQNQFVFNTTYSTGKTISTQIGRATANDCGDYALYYINRKGGLDSYLLRGKCVMTSEFEQSTYEKGIDNNYLDYEREKTRYRNDIGFSWELNTGWLKDSESKILSRHLFSSNDVYLHNLDTDEVIPVIIKDSSVDEKTYKTERKLFNYTINVEASNKELVL